jgi:hypothetical protein
MVNWAVGLHDSPPQCFSNSRRRSSPCRGDGLCCWRCRERGEKRQQPPFAASGAPGGSPFSCGSNRRRKPTRERGRRGIVPVRRRESAAQQFATRPQVSSCVLSRLAAVLLQPLLNIATPEKTSPPYLERREFAGLNKLVHPRLAEPKPDADLIHSEHFLLARYSRCLQPHLAAPLFAEDR